MFLLSFLSVFFSCLLQLVSSQKAETLIPLSANSYGFHAGSASSSIIVEFNIDLGCSSCLDSWPTMKQVQEIYASSVHFIYRIFPLPYHQQAFILSKAANCVNFFSPDAIFKFMDTCFDNQAEIYNSATADMSYNDVVALVEPWAVSAGITSEQYYEGMNTSTTNGNAIEMNARYMFKYATLHDIYATPMYIINGEKVMGLNSYETWAATLDSLLGSTA